MKTFVSSAQTLLLVLTWLFSQCHADTHVLIVPNDSALDLEDAGQCGYIREAYADIISECAPEAVDSDLAHFVDDFEPIEAALDLPDVRQRSLRALQNRRRKSCGDCRRNPDACCMLGAYFHCSVCMTKRRKRRLESSELADQFRLTTQLPAVSGECKRKLDEQCSIKAEQNLLDEMQCWGCKADGTWDGDISAFNVLSGTEGSTGI